MSVFATHVFFSLLHNFSSQHEELEHLALIEQACECFPLPMVDQSRHGVKYFDRHSRVRYSELAADSRRVVDSMIPLKVSIVCESVSVMRNEKATFVLFFLFFRSSVTSSSQSLNIPLSLFVHLSQRYFTLAPEDVSSGVADLVTACLRVDPHSR